MSLSLSSAPNIVWRLYVDSLWRWTDQPTSWISHTAYVCRILAILLIIPFLLLILVDIVSYGIARTLGVIDLTDASTSDNKTIHGTGKGKGRVPVVQIMPSSPDAMTTVTKTEGRPALQCDISPLDTLPPLNMENASPSQEAYFTSEPNSLKLSGVGLFSPAASRPPSPTITRKSLPPDEKLVDLDEEEGIVFRKRATRKPQGHDEDERQ
ncbi:hypothetical protein MIND_00063500 [Mycena indigotica]|uniref:Transmembrane protein n=1 Tax=Mycena indigotica TaxID=2126181 RepID=A0A8H6WHV6_9AGAR|nr:uncharacterized protein MIND_00063500 [Mycena indigotica]KAF7315483.1 hypothetical protein MIND_00063500 [Mycena indigotica]